jgi:hypothetical protein
MCGAQFALCLAAILVERMTAEELGSNFGLFVRMMLDGCQSPSPFVAQAATCGLGIACQFSPAAFEPMLSESVENLIAVWNFEEAQADIERWGILDNVSSSCGKIAARFAAEGALSLEAREKLLFTFLARVPFEQDEDENDWAARTATALLTNNDKQFSKILRSSNAYLHHLSRLADHQYLVSVHGDLSQKLRDAAATAGFELGQEFTIGPPFT